MHASKPYNLSAISNIILFPEWNYITLSSDSILKKKLNRQEKDRPHSIALKKKPKPTEKTPEPWLHPIGPHRNLGRPRPIVLAALQLPPSRRVQTNHKCYRPVPRHFFLGCQQGFLLLCCHQDLNPGWCLPQLGSLPLHYRSVGFQ